MSHKIYTNSSEIGEKRLFLPLLFTLCSILFILRKPIYALVQPGKIEDVDPLLREAIQYSWSSIFVVYNYYLHFIPRLVTIISLNLVGIANAPLAMNLSAIVIATLCALFFSTRQFRFIIKNDFLRSVCSLFIILVPGINQIYSNISDIQFFLNIFTMLFTTLILFRYEEYQKQSKKMKYFYAFFCSISFLSSAFSIVFLPALVYVIIREFRKNRNEISTILSYTIPTILLLFQALVLYVTYSQQFKTPIIHNSGIIIKSIVDAFSTSIIQIFYHNVSNVFQSLGEWTYLIPIIVIAFIFLNSIKNGLRFEIFCLYAIITILFWSVIIRGDFAERYFAFPIIFLFILIVRQFDKKRSLLFKIIFLPIIVIIFINIASGFSISTPIDDNWKYVAKAYDSSGPYHCYIAEVPQGWEISVPCSRPISNNVTTNMIPSSSPSISSGSSVTFTPPVASTNTTIMSNSPSITSGQIVTFTATISPIPDYGSVQFYIDDTPIGRPITIFGGQSTFSISSMSVGLHHIYASFSGAPDFYASTSDQITVRVLSTSNLKDANISGANGCNGCP